MENGVTIVAIAFAVCLVFAVRAGLRHLRGEGGCCCGAGGPPPTLDGKKIGPVVARRVLALDGLHCANCVSGVKAALEAIPGVAADVTLDPQRALVRMDRAIPDESLREAVEEQGFRVVSVNDPSKS